MYRNLYKKGYTFVSEENARIIDSNVLMEQKISKESLGRISPMPEDEDGFSKGLSAEVLNVLTKDMEDGNEEDYYAGEDMPKEPTPDEMREAAMREINAWREEAQAEIDIARRKAFDEAKQQGYQDGYTKGIQEVEGMKQKLEEEKKQLKRQYEEQILQLEPQFVDTLTGIYEHLFKVELSGYKELIVHLIGSTMRKIDGSKSFIIHVSREDYAYVSMQKKQLMAGVSANSAIELVEDITMSKNEALIETDGGIFDCSLGTQLSELAKRLKLLSYERSEKE